MPATCIAGETDSTRSRRNPSCGVGADRWIRDAARRKEMKRVDELDEVVDSARIDYGNHGGVSLELRRKETSRRGTDGKQH